ncbi:MAG: lipoprotein insertase outer membrane protein LolB [Porticoccaceae bacterium]
MGALLSDHNNAIVLPINIKENTPMKIPAPLKILIPLLWLSACSNIQHHSESTISGLVFDSPNTAALSTWQLTGKLGVRSAQQAVSAQLHWQQNQQQYQLRLSGPLGAGSVVANGDNHSIEAQQGSKTYRGSPRDLGRQLFDLPLPVDAINWWLRALPAPQLSAARNLTTRLDGTPQGFEQDGWQLTFARFEPVGDYLLPRKISGQSGDLSFKLVISKWRL